MGELVLASGSPRRRELLGLLGVPFVVRVPDVDESVHRGEDPRAYVERLAGTKAQAVAAGPDDVVVAADTTVVVGGRVCGKPADDAEARAMLAALAGRTHEVHTGVAVRWREQVLTAVATTEVVLTAMTGAAVDWYVATGEPADKAGAYAVQGIGGLFVAEVRGNVHNVIGLPVHLVAELAARLGAPLGGPPIR